MKIWNQNPLQTQVPSENIVPGETSWSRVLHDGSSRVFLSASSVEKTPFGEIPSQLRISQVGERLLKNNKGLLSRIQNGTLPFESIMHGQEGTVGVVTLDTDEGRQRFCIKYVTPVMRRKDEGLIPLVEDHILYTPQVDAMVAMELAAEQSPVKGINYVVPILASLNVSVTPYIENAIPLEDLRNLDSYDTSDENLGNLVTKVLNHSNWHFLSSALQSNDFPYVINPKGWPVGKMQQFIGTVNKDDRMLHRSYGTGEAGSPHNTLVSLPLLLSLLDKMQSWDISHMRFTDYDYTDNITFETELLKGFRKSCYVLEIICGLFPVSSITQLHTE